MEPVTNFNYEIPRWDISLSFVSNATLRITYAEMSVENYLADAAQLSICQQNNDYSLDLSQKNADYLVAYFSSRCVASRDAWVTELSKYDCVRMVI